MTAPVLVRNLVPVAGNNILGLVDVIVIDGPWQFVFRRCRWRIDEHGERVETVCGPFELRSPGATAEFQRLVLAGARQLVDQKPQAIGSTA
jgi:hypothetical protein